MRSNLLVQFSFSACQKLHESKLPESLFVQFSFSDGKTPQNLCFLDRFLSCFCSQLGKNCTNLNCPITILSSFSSQLDKNCPKLHFLKSPFCPVFILGLTKSLQICTVRIASYVQFSFSAWQTVINCLFSMPQIKAKIK